jgi:hypothetical protein
MVTKFTQDEIEFLHNSSPAMQRAKLGQKLNETIDQANSGGGGGASPVKEYTIDGNMVVADGLLAAQIKKGFSATEINWVLEGSPTGASVIIELEYSTDGHTWNTLVDTGVIPAGAYSDMNIISHTFADKSFIRINCTQAGNILTGTRLMVGIS